ncbi:unnamed protein product, partial [Meganyctiphanes norvegica]
MKMETMTLNQAAASGNIEVLKSILSGDPDVDIDIGDGKEATPLHLAATCGHLQVLELLIEHGASVNCTNEHRQTPLHLAVEKGHVAIVEALLKAGAEADVRERKKGRTPLHIGTIHNAIPILKLIMESLKHDVWESRRVMKIADKEGRNTLHLAASAGKLEAMGLCLAAGAEVNISDFSGATPMHSAILSKKAACTQLLVMLLDSGGDLHCGMEDNEEGTLAHAAVKVGCLPCLQALAERGATLDAQDITSRTPLHYAVEGRREKCINFLMEKGCSFETADRRGFLPIHCAIRADSPNIVRKMLTAGADPNALDKDGRSYVQFAMILKKFEVFKTLVDCGATRIGADEKDLILHYCAGAGNQKAVQMMVELGKDVNEPDGFGRGALHHAINYGHENLSNYLLANGADVQQTDFAGATPLHYAVRWGGSDSLIRILLKNNAILGALDRLGRTPLHYAASKSSVMSDLVLLVGRGARVDVRDHMGLTALHLASRLGNESLVRVLLENGARHDFRDVHNFMPIDHAKENNHKSIEKRLEQHAQVKRLEQKAKGIGSHYINSDDEEDE